MTLRKPAISGRKGEKKARHCSSVLLYVGSAMGKPYYSNRSVQKPKSFWVVHPPELFLTLDHDEQLVCLLSDRFLPQKPTVPLIMLKCVISRRLMYAQARQEPLKIINSARSTALGTRTRTYQVHQPILFPLSLRTPKSKYSQTTGNNATSSTSPTPSSTLPLPVGHSLHPHPISLLHAIPHPHFPHLHDSRRINLVRNPRPFILNHRSKPNLNTDHGDKVTALTSFSRDVAAAAYVPCKRRGNYFWKLRT